MISNTSHTKMNYLSAQLESAWESRNPLGEELGHYLFMAVVGLIGFMNMAKHLSCNITTKKQEI